MHIAKIFRSSTGEPVTTSIPMTRDDALIWAAAFVRDNADTYYEVVLA